MERGAWLLLLVALTVTGTGAAQAQSATAPVTAATPSQVNIYSTPVPRPARNAQRRRNQLQSTHNRLS